LPAVLRHWKWGAGIVVAAVVLAVAVRGLLPEPVAAEFGYEVVAVYPHDPQAYCQGLEFADGVLYESTGQYGQSTLRKVDLATGDVLASYALDERLFGEGLSVLGERIFQLTWRRGIGLIYDRRTLAPQARFGYRGEGWGLANDGKHLIMSDGTPVLRFLDPESFEVVATRQVTDKGRPVDHLNELEYIEGEIFANIWFSDRIARISPRTGNVLGWIDLAGLLAPGERPSGDAVLNGIAYDAEGQRLFVTGKNWPKLFEIRVVKKR